MASTGGVPGFFLLALLQTTFFFPSQWRPEMFAGFPPAVVGIPRVRGAFATSTVYSQRWFQLAGDDALVKVWGELFDKAQTGFPAFWHVRDQSGEVRDSFGEVIPNREPEERAHPPNDCWAKP